MHLFGVSPSHRGCEAPVASIDGWAQVGSCTGIACDWNSPWPNPLADTNEYSVCGIRQAEFFLRPSPWCNPFVFFIEDEQEANWIFVQFGRSLADKVQWLSPIFGKQLACDCGQSKCHTAVLDELMCEMLTSGAMMNAVISVSVFLDYASGRFCIVTIFQTCDTDLNPDFNLQNPFFFRCGCGFTSGRKSSTTEFAFLKCCNPGQVDAIATASDKVLDLDAITIHRIFCVGLGTFECALGRHVPAWTKLGAISSLTRPISNVARRVTLVIQQVRRAVPQPIHEGLAQIFMLLWLETLSTFFFVLQLSIMYVTKYAL